MNRRELQKLVGLMATSGALDVKTGKLDVNKLQGHWSIEDGGRRGVKITRTAKGAGADDNQGGKQRGCNG